MMNHRSSAAITLLAALAMSSALPASAGTTGAISGKVVDAATGAPVVATVTAVSASQKVSTVTDKSGSFRFNTLGPDDYVITVFKKGTATSTHVAVFADEVESIDLKVQ